MRQFIILGHDAAVTPDFTLNDLPGSAGRIDVLCRCINSAFLLSHGLREDVRVHLVLQDRYAIRLEGSELQYVNPDERSTAALLKRALEKAQEVDVTMEQRSSPGIYIKEQGFSKLLERVADEAGVVQLHEDGDPIETVSLPENPLFVLSDHNEFTVDEEQLLQEHASHRVSVGPKALHADHVITIVQNVVDRSQRQ